jgi:hypothetical protein
MFGGVTFWCFWDNGYQALAALDDDGDGWLRGKELDGLAIWHDANGNGICEPAEVKPLAEWGIVVLCCRADPGPPSPYCAAQASKGVVFKDGRSRPTYDVVLREWLQAQEVPGNREDPTKRRSTPGGLQDRQVRDREQLLQERGGSAASEAAVAKGLCWLALHQAANGSWSLDQFPLCARTELNSTKYFNDNSTGRGMKNDIAGTAFDLLPFLAAGITHKPSGKKQDDVYVRTVSRGISFLVSKQNREGGFEGSGSLYGHGLATIALCEAYALTRDPNLRRPAQLAINYLVFAQDPLKGGWRYTPRGGSDTSVTGWQVIALKTGQLAGLTVPAGTLRGAGKWLNSCETQDGGGFGYTDNRETPTLTAVGLLCRLYLGAQPDNAKLKNGIDKLKKSPPQAQQNIYREYYVTQTLYHVGGDAWDWWNKGADQKKGMREILIDRQGMDGSWDPRGDHFSAQGGRIMQTSLSLLTLQVYYRYPPLHQRAAPEKKEK